MQTPCVVIPNWNGHDGLRKCLDSLQKQSLRPHIIVVDNGSVDSSVDLIKKEYPKVELIEHDKNKGYAGGVNPGFRLAQKIGSKYVAAFNNDAVADKDWLLKLASYLDKHESVGVAACKLLNADGSHIDSAGDYYTLWGLPYPRGRGEKDIDKYDGSIDIFSASGGASLYRVKMLNEIGLLDEDFFAYYEDVDLSFRAQLAGWKVAYVSSSITYHQIGATSSVIKGFTTYQTMKNLPWLMWKNVPTPLLWKILPRFTLAYTGFLFSAIQRGQGLSAFKGFFVSILLLPKKIVQRWSIQRNRKVKPSYIWDIIVHDLPPNADKLRLLRSRWWTMQGKS